MLVHQEIGMVSVSTVVGVELITIPISQQADESDRMSHHKGMRKARGITYGIMPI